MDLIWFDDVDAIWCHETRVLPPGLHPDAILGDGTEEEVSRERKKVFLVGQNLGDMWKCRKHEHPDIWKAAGLKIDQG